MCECTEIYVIMETIENPYIISWWRNIDINIGVIIRS